MKDIKERIESLLEKLNEVENDSEKIYNLAKEYEKYYQKKILSEVIENRISYDTMRFFGYMLKANDRRIKDIKKNIKMAQSLMNNSGPFFRLKHDIILLEKIFYSPRIEIGSFEYDKRVKYYIRFFYKDDNTVSLAVAVNDSGYDIEVLCGIRKNLSEMKTIGKIFMDPKNYTDECRMFINNIFDERTGLRFLNNIISLLELLPGLSDDGIDRLIDNQILCLSKVIDEEYFKSVAINLFDKDINIISTDNTIWIEKVDEAKELNLEFVCNKINNPAINKMAENLKNCINNMKINDNKGE